MNSGHVKWAQGHDWCKAARLEANGDITITTEDDNGEVSETFKSFKCLRAWAGY